MKKCFVIMPFSKTTTKRTEQYWTNHFNNFLKNKIESFGGYQVTRSKPSRGQILPEIINDLISADIVIADLTDNNPNVYYELGIRQSFKHGTITIAEYGTKLPFDIKVKGVLFYHPKDHIKNSAFEIHLKETLTDCIKNPNRPDSAILETITGRTSFYELINKEEIIRRLYAVVNEYTHNQKHQKKIIDYAHKRKAKENVGYPVELFRCSSVELLITNQYLNADNEFYLKCEKYYDLLINTNTRLASWPTRDAAITDWIIKVENSNKKIIEEFRSAIHKVITEKGYNK